MPDIGSSELLQRIINAGFKYSALDVTSLDHIPDLDVDQWSTEQEVEEARVKAEKALKESIGMDVDLDERFGGKYLGLGLGFRV